MKRKLYRFIAISCLTFLSETRARAIFRMKAKDGNLSLRLDKMKYLLLFRLDKMKYNI
ncbi:MAG: hypothetical protein WCP32_05040 [Bacteroidota bacterium]